MPRGLGGEKDPANNCAPSDRVWNGVNIARELSMRRCCCCTSPEAHRTWKTPRTWHAWLPSGFNSNASQSPRQCRAQAIFSPLPAVCAEIRFSVVNAGSTQMRVYSAHPASTNRLGFACTTTRACYWSWSSPPSKISSFSVVTPYYTKAREGLSTAWKEDCRFWSNKSTVADSACFVLPQLRQRSFFPKAHDSRQFRIFSKSSRLTAWWNVSIFGSDHWLDMTKMSPDPGADCSTIRGA